VAERGFEIPAEDVEAALGRGVLRGLTKRATAEPDGKPTEESDGRPPNGWLEARREYEAGRPPCGMEPHPDVVTALANAVVARWEVAGMTWNGDRNLPQPATEGPTPICYANTWVARAIRRGVRYELDGSGLPRPSGGACG
jgi:hypothetical protein